MKLTIFYRGMLLLVFLTGCSGLFPATVLTPTTIPATATPTATIVWFPPTNTPTVFPTQTLHATPQQRPGLGELIFRDTFDQPELWSTSVGSQASATVTDNKLLLSISVQGPLSVTSLRSQPTLGDFYAEATVTLNLCGENDQFGMIFHAAPGDNHYRFSVRCDGQLRIERRLSGSTMPLLDWMPSGDAPNAVPAVVKLGIWVVGREMRFFLNDQYQISASDPILHEGSLGFYIFANGSTPITISFSDLSVYSVAYISPTPSLTLSRTPTPMYTPIPSQTPSP